MKRNKVSENVRGVYVITIHCGKNDTQKIFSDTKLSKLISSIVRNIYDNSVNWEQNSVDLGRKTREIVQC